LNEQDDKNQEAIQRLERVLAQKHKFRDKKSEYFVILGPTGAGKTLLLETIAGFYFPDSGEVLIEGQK